MAEHEFGSDAVECTRGVRADQDAPVSLVAALFTRNGEYISSIFEGAPELGDAIKYSKGTDLDGKYDVLQPPQLTRHDNNNKTFTSWKWNTVVLKQPL